MQASEFMKVLVPLGLVVCSVSVTAADVPNVGDLGRIQGETILLKAQTKREEAQAELAARRQGGVSADGTLPVLKSIYGTEKRLVVTFLYPGNVTVEANEGDQIPGGYRVSKIFAETSKVDLAKGREKFQVGFSTLAPTSRQVTGQGNNAGAFVPGINR